LSTPFSKTVQSLKQDNSYFAFAIWAIASVIFIFWMIWFLYGNVEVIEISSKAKLQVEQSPHVVTTFVPSKIITNNLTIGQFVNVGDVLVELDASTQILQLKEEEAKLAATPTKIASLKTELLILANAKTQDQQAAISAVQAAKFRRQESSVVEGFAKDQSKRFTQESNLGSVSKLEALKAEADYQKLNASSSALLAEASKIESDARFRLQQNDARIENAKRDLQAAESEFDRIQITVARLHEEIGRFIIRAPVSGHIGDVIQFKVGAYVTEGEKLATIVPQGGVIIVADFQPSSVLGRIKPGQLSRMRLDGFPWTQYGTIKAKVNKVSTEVRENLVRVELSPILEEHTKDLLQHGLPGIVEVSIEHIPPYILLLRTIGQKMSHDSHQVSSQTSPQSNPEK
jgi:membrane fusion protein (multidrug efflux system)